LRATRKELPLQSDFHVPVEKHAMYPKLLVAVASLFWLGAASAGVEDSLKAFQAQDFPAALAEARKAANAHDPRAYFIMGILYESGSGVQADPKQAFAWYEKAAKGGVTGAQSKLAWAYVHGDGTARNLDIALAHARLSAAAGDPEGMFLVYLALSASPLRTIGDNGRPDEEKYKALAARPAAQRSLDTEARDALYRSAQKGFPLAVVTLATSLGATLGDGNRKKMLTLVETVPSHRVPALKNYESTGRHMETLGDSYATPQLFADAQGPQMTAAAVKACGLNPTREQLAEPSSLVSTSISKPLSDAVYLPSHVSGFERAYLIAGTWEEEWRYKACGNTASVIVKFKADGLGGARNESVMAGKDVQGVLKP
jgi:TPR repeat protein